MVLQHLINLCLYHLLYTHFDSFDNQISAKLSFTVQTFKKQNSMDIEKYNGLMIDVRYLVRQPQINNGIVIINFADNNAFV